MSRFYMFKGHSRCEFELPSSGFNPIKRWNNRLHKKAKLEEIFWKVEQEYGPAQENEPQTWLKKHVRGYMKFNKPVTVKQLMNMNQPDFTYVVCQEGYEDENCSRMFSNT